MLSSFPMALTQNRTGGAASTYAYAHGPAPARRQLLLRLDKILADEQLHPAQDHKTANSRRHR